MGTQYDWAALVQTRAGITPTTNTNDNFVRWMAAENPPSDWWHLNNPLNCGLDDGSADGEGSYPSLDVAATYTAQVLSQENMAPIWNALNEDADLAVFSAGCADSEWSTGGYHGNPGFIASVPEPVAIDSPAPFPSPTPAPPPAPVPIPGDEMFPENPTQAQFNVNVRLVWYLLRTDIPSAAEFGLLWDLWNVALGAPGPFGATGFGQTWDLVVANIHDTAGANLKA